MPTTASTHIRLDDRGVAWIDETKTKVIEVALDQIAHGWSPEEIHFQHGHLSLGQIHAALGYYYDHKTEMDAEIQRGLARVNELRREAGESPLRKKLRAMHRKFRHAKFPGSLILSGHSGDDAKHYQEKEVRNAIHDVSK